MGLLTFAISSGLRPLAGAVAFASSPLTSPTTHEVIGPPSLSLSERGTRPV
jgi:hypothetical protein